MPSIKQCAWSASLAAAAVLFSRGDVQAQAPDSPPAPTAAQQASPPAPQYPEYPSETPPKFVPSHDGADFESREVMIPMRDGVELRTFILVPRGAHRAAILLTRTPYDAKHMTSINPSLHLGSRLWGYDNAVETLIEGGYIRVVQDIRGKYGSQGDYVMNRPMHGPLNPTPVDESTDTYDTIDWLVKHVPESNGRVGVLGISYDGFLALTPLVNPHPALKVAVPMNPMVDGWRGDDWFHNGAFREQNIPYIYEQTATRSNDELWQSGSFDDYDLYMRAGSAGELGRRYGMEQIGFWRKLVAHPAYDSFWREQAMDRVLARAPLTVPTMLVAGLWDQEDIYGAIAVYKALYANPINRQRLFLVLGPWYHGQEIEEASALGPIRFGSDTGLYFRRQILAPFLAHYLKDDGGSAAPVAPVLAFQTGVNRWQRLPSWPSGCDGACEPTRTPLYLLAGGKVGFDAPAAGPAFDEYVSDPAKPVPFRARPSQPVGYTAPLSWVRWLVDDQREFSGRTDVLTYSSAPLEAPLAVSGEPVANLVAATSGTDVDWVVKLIDVYPDEVPGQAELGGYQLPVAMDIFRGRYREDLATAKPVKPNVPLTYRFALPTTDHVFLPGHRIMVQVQSAWFPLYDRNPQTFVPNIFFAKPTDYKKASERIYHTAAKASFVELPIVPAPAAF
ncbi:MAG TPA: CocE/NonD family hydrolase [Steroidobacteraceae bacterium]|nr:CocE/NonD family hydrolase [Steroidobacteraceae bacterium]